MVESYLGVKVSPLNYDQIITEIQKRMLTGSQSTIIAVNPEKVMTAQRDDQIKQLINQSTFQIADGVGILIASRLKGGAIRSRVTGVDMMSRLLQMAEQGQYSVYFYGAKEEIIQKAIHNIQMKYPLLKIAGYTNGYEKNETKIVSSIHNSGAQLVFVALGSPKQELWIERNLSQLPNVQVFQGVGGSIDVFSGTVKRAPEAFQKIGMEWLYRLLTNPKRFKRQLNLPLFLWKVIVSK